MHGHQNLKPERNFNQFMRFVQSVMYLILAIGGVKSTADSLSVVVISGAFASCTSPLSIIPNNPVQEPFLRLAPGELSTDLM
jgi:hypothetical protein